MAITSLPYHEPGVETILIQSSFVLLLNVVNCVIDRSIYCGLLGQVFLGVAWGTPGSKWLSVEAEEVIVQLGYLGLLLLVYEGGLSTSFGALKANLVMSLCVAITGISLPMALSFVLQKLTGATPIQSFAAGAALCSTSLGTTFTVLGSSGLIKSRLGVVLTSAAMMDDVVGLVLVQIISNLDTSSADISAATILRPLLVSVAFAVCAPLACWSVARPLTLWLNGHRENRPLSLINRVLTKSRIVWVFHSSILLACVVGSSYAGTSNLFAAYIAGASITWWDSEVPHPIFDATASSEPTSPPEDPSERTEPTAGPCEDEPNTLSPPPQPNMEAFGKPTFSGNYIYEHYYMQPVDKILRPFFFASIGFSIPITEMFRSAIVWKGIIYAVLMAIGKLACGLWLIRISPVLRIPNNIPIVSKVLKSRIKSCTSEGRSKKTCSSPTTEPPTSSDPGKQSAPASCPTEATSPNSSRHATPAGAKPRSVYPASMLGCAMVARGEIGFLISSIAESRGVFRSTSGSDSGQSSDIFLIATWAIVLCTILGPLAVGLLVRRLKQLERNVEKEGRTLQAGVLGAGVGWCD